MIQIKEFTKVPGPFSSLEESVNSWIQEHEETAKIIDVKFNEKSAFIIYDVERSKVGSPDW